MNVTEAGVATFSNIAVTGGYIATTGYIYGTGSSGYGGGASVAGVNATAANPGLYGYSTSGYGVYAESGSAGTALFANNQGTGYAIRASGLSTFDKQIQSTLAIGTAPFSIVSTTRVSNLNVATAGTADAVAGTGLTGTSLASNIVTSSLTTVGELSALNVNVATTAVFKASAGGSNAVTVDSLGNINAGCSLGTGVYYCQNSAGETFNSAVASLNVKGGIIIGHT